MVVQWTAKLTAGLIANRRAEAVAVGIAAFGAARLLVPLFDPRLDPTHDRGTASLGGAGSLTDTQMELGDEARERLDEATEDFDLDGLGC